MKGVGQRERETQNPKQVPGSAELSAQSPWHGAWTYEPWDHDLSWSWMLNRLSHPGAPRYANFKFWSSLWLPLKNLVQIYISCRVVRNLPCQLCILFLLNFYYESNSKNYSINIFKCISLIIYKVIPSCLLAICISSVNYSNSWLSSICFIFFFYN